MTLGEIIKKDNLKEVICPRCGSKAIADVGFVLTSYPPKYNVDCPKCGRIYMDCSEVNRQIYKDPIEETIKNNLSLDIRNDLRGNKHLCLLFGEEAISTINISEIWMDMQNFNG